MSVRTPHLVRRHVSGTFAGRPEHFFPDADAEGRYVLKDRSISNDWTEAGGEFYADSIRTALHLVRNYGFAIKMRGNLTDEWVVIDRDQIEDL